jgi:uncharacterized protein (TIGR03435 family)
MIWPRQLILLAGFPIACVLNAPTQTPQSPLTYDIVSVRACERNAEQVGIDPLPNGVGYNAVCVPVKVMLSVMYRMPMRQIVGGPAWMSDQKFTVLARADHRYSTDELHAMFQNMLADRFNLKLHMVTKTGPVYVLKVAKSGAKMIPVKEGLRNSPIVTEGENKYTGSRVPMPYLCYWLGRMLEEDHRPVVDRTNLTGYFDFKVSFRPQLPPDAYSGRKAQNLPTIFDAMRDQLGLELVPQKGPVETLVVDSLDQPTPN